MAAVALNPYCTLCDRHYDTAFRRCPRDGGRLVSLDGTLPAGSRVGGRYTIIRLIGRGGMGDVYLARAGAESAAPGDDVALKILHPRFAGSAAAERRFLREAQAVRGLAHPNVVRYLDEGAAGDSVYYLVMEYLPGRPLTALIVREAPLPVARTARLLSQVCDALAAAHASGIVHRDLKPDNVFLVQGEDGSERAKVLDFGVARLVDPDDSAPGQTEPGAICGTASYMCPEQARGRPVDARADVYSLGLILHEMLSGTHMFPGTQQLEVLLKQVHQEPVSVLASHPHLDIPRALDDLILDALAKHPDARPANMRVFRERLAAAAAETSPRPAHAGRVHPPLYTGAALLPATDVPGPAAQPGPGGATSGGVAPTDLFLFSFPMVGRAMQRQALVGYFDGVVRDRAGQCIALEGELGMGKTKLVEWLAAHAGQRLDARVVGGEQLRHAPLPLSTVRQALEDLLRVSPHGSEEHVRSALAAAAAGWARDPQVRLPGGIDLDLLHDFLRPTPESYRKTSQEESVWKDRLFAALARVFVAESLRRPLALVLEEMHWAQALTAQFVEYLMAELMRAPSRLLLVLTYQQSEARDDLPLWETLRWLARLDGHRFHRVRLERLAGAELRTFLQQICRADGALVDYVAYMAGGNPLHTLQLLRYLRNEALLEATPRGWRLKPQVGGLRLVPPGLGDLVDLRVQRFLSRQADRAGYQRVLQRAALLGQRFPVSLLLRLLGEEGDHALRDQLDDLLDGLEAEGLLRSDPADREQLVFDHGLIREVVLRNLAGRRQTRRLHALVARAMEAEYADRLPDHALAIAEHCLAGGEESRAADLFLMAARAAAEGLDHVRALDALQRAEQALSECEASPRARWLPLWEQLGRVSLTLGDRARALASFARLRDEAALCDAPRAQVEAFLGLAAVARLEARWDDAFAALDQAAALCAGTGDGHGLASIHAQRGAIYERHARYQEAVAAYETAAEVFAALADRHRLADCQVALGLLEEWRGDSARAEALLETAIGLSDVAGQMRGWNNLGVVAMQRGLPLRAIECYERALALAERAGYREALAHSLANIGAAQILLARHAEARETLSRAYAIRDEIGDRWGVANALNNLAAVDLGEGDLERAYRLASSAREIYGALAAPRGVATALTNMGSAQRRLGDPERAARHYRDALDAAPTPETRWEALGEAHAGLADILGAAGDRDGARRHGRAAAEIYAALGNETAAARLRAQAAAPA